EAGILQGIYRCGGVAAETAEVHLLGSGSIMQQVLQAQQTLEAWGYQVTLWSVTSYNELYREAESCERYNRLHCDAAQRVPVVQQLFAATSGTVVATSDYMKSLPNSIARWMPDNYLVLGTDGYGLSETRTELRRYFEVSADDICHAALVGLRRQEHITDTVFQNRLGELNIDPAKADPMQH
ncbi:unnamed protein product, partial [Discosporangium mesarthrocarpum]